MSSFLDCQPHGAASLLVASLSYLSFRSGEILCPIFQVLQEAGVSTQTMQEVLSELRALVVVNDS